MTPPHERYRSFLEALTPETLDRLVERGFVGAAVDPEKKSGMQWEQCQFRCSCPIK